MSSPLSTTKKSTVCIPCAYCNSVDTVKRGFRQKKRERVQLYLCRDCKKTFTSQSVKGKHYPLAAIIEGISYYNLGFSLAQACRIVNEKLGLLFPLPKLRAAEAKSPRGQKGTSPVASTSGNVGSGIQPSSLANWIEEHKDLCRYHRYRPFGVKMFSPMNTVVSATLAHRQLYRFRYHQAKIRLIIREDIKHAKFGSLADYLALVPSETPHQYFQDGSAASRSSEAPIRFSKENMIVRSKQNFANKLAAFVLQTVKKNKDRHEAVQRFMLANDTVTVATEVPVYIKREDLLHMQTQLGFEFYGRAAGVARRRGKSPMGQKGTSPIASTKSNIGSGLRQLSAAELPGLITGHIDLVQVRNGQIHILDYKPNAAKEKPIEQLTLYAMALSRLTGLRLYCFTCAWFDEKDYFEFFPLHVVYKRKPKGRKRRSDSKKIVTKEGVYMMNALPTRVEHLRPIHPSL